MPSNLPDISPDKEIRLTKPLEFTARVWARPAPPPLLPRRGTALSNVLVRMRDGQFDRLMALGKNGTKIEFSRRAFSSLFGSLSPASLAPVSTLSSFTFISLDT
ncbi:hypothetical protein M413DRAFT_444524 [Hebeloma cylindrosporum]|uniref:Uncharacterized protein n=1 Tax=Hebeloma cylindrosporum TaxID=76867 RepID=A0A0C2XZ32_HEBCY|nr:hypothetical protein M413DRAFT_444524 [Hebeloma cylindrosporum h7]